MTDELYKIKGEGADMEVFARTIYTQGKFVEYALSIFNKNWYSDSKIFKALMIQAANHRVLNNHVGISIHISGDAQSGKSELARYTGKFVPRQSFYEGTFSKYALFEPKLVHDCMTLFSDDTSFDTDVEEVVKNILTSYDEGTGRLTREDKEWVMKKTAKRLQLILTSVESVGLHDSQNQLDSRFLTLELQRNEETRNMIFKALQTEPIDIREELAIIQMIWDCVAEEEVKIHKIFTPQEVPSADFRDMKRFLAMLRAHARLYNRTETNDFDVAEIFDIMSNARISVSATRAGLSRNEKFVWNAVSSMPESINTLCEATGMTRVAVCRALFGPGQSASNPDGGLAAKKQLGIRQDKDDGGVWTVFRLKQV